MAERNPKPKDDGQTDVAGRNAASTSAEGDVNANTQLQAREQTAADSSVSPKSSTLQNPDAEIRADLTQDVLTANRTLVSEQILASGGSPENADKMQALHQAVADAQVKVDAAIAERNAARDAYDREAEAQAVGGATDFGSQISGYQKAQAEARERQAKANEAAARKAIA